MHKNGDEYPPLATHLIILQIYHHERSKIN